MKGLTGPVQRAQVALGCAVVLVAFAMSTARADDRIPRPPGAIDNRGWELVSKDKNRNPASQGAQLAPNGDRILYSLLGAFPGSSSGTRAIVLATRTDDGWTSRSVLPPRAEMFHESYLPTIASPDFGTIIATALAGFGPNSPDQGLVRLDDEGHQTLLHVFPTVTGGSGLEAVASADLSHIFATTRETIDPSHVSGTKNVYEFDGTANTTPVLVSRLPGTNQAPACGVLESPPGGFAGISGSVTQHWVSTDGRYGFFETQGDNCGDPVQLYRRDVVAGTTAKVSGPVVGGDPDNGADNFLKAAPDGSVAIFKTATSLDPADDTDGDASDMDIYRWSASGGNECLTCAVPNANVAPPLFWNYNAVVSQDLSHVYFMSQGQFAGAPAPGDGFNNNMYVWHNGTIDFVAPANALAYHPFDGTEVTPDGNVLVFPSLNPALDAVTGRSNGGFFQFYRYDDRTGDVTCISCPSTGPATSSVPQVLTSGTQAVQADTRAMSDDGSMVFFLTDDSLVPQDVNGGRDLYEWHDGQVGLISSGREQYATTGNGPFVATISPDGRDVLFDDTAQLTSETAGDSTRKVYDARIGGGFPPAPTPPQPCEGAQCRGLLAGTPDLLEPGSASLTGAGNTRPSRSRALTLGRITARQRLHLAQTGRLTLSVRLRHGGRLSARLRARLGGRARTVAHASRTAGGGGVVKLRLRLSDAARARLARTGRLTLTLEVRFSGSSVARRITLSSTGTSVHGR